MDFTAGRPPATIISKIIKEVTMKSLAGKSLLLFGLCVLILVGITVSESAMGAMSLMVQRVVTLAGLVLPAVYGVFLGVQSLVKREGRPWLASAGIVLNGLIAAFHLLIVLYAE
jgi:hypothetical protein